MTTTSGTYHAAATVAGNTPWSTATPGAGSVNNSAIGGGLGNGAGAVSCKSNYVYWSEMVGHTAGQAGSQWRTDLVARNLESSTASLRFILHQASGDLEATGTVNGNSQKAFEDLTAIMGPSNQAMTAVTSMSGGGGFGPPPLFVGSLRCLAQRQHDAHLN